MLLVVVLMALFWGCCDSREDLEKAAQQAEALKRVSQGPVYPSSVSGTVADIAVLYAEREKERDGRMWGLLPETHQLIEAKEKELMATEEARLATEKKKRQKDWFR